MTSRAVNRRKTSAKKGRAQIATALKERLVGGQDPREHRVAVLAGVGQGLAQRPGGAQDDGEPEPDQKVQRPGALPLGLAYTSKGGMTEGRGDVLVQQVDKPQQVDRAASGHSTSQ